MQIEDFFVYYTKIIHSSMNMKRIKDKMRGVLLAGLLGSSSALQAQSITGKVVDEENQPIEYANVALLRTDSSFVEGTVTATDGTFRLKERTGSYLLKVSSVGYQTLIEQCTPQANNLLQLHAGTELAEVSVTAQRQLVKSEVDRTTYDVQGDPDVKSSSVSEMLRKVPFVTVDSEGNISVNGSTNIAIYKNGRPNRNYTNNAKDVLAAIPADMVKHIEVITEPGAKYDGEGADAVLNIITDERRTLNGVMGTASANLNSLGQHYGNIYLTSQIRKFTFNLNYAGQRISKTGSQNWNESEYHYLSSGHTYRNSRVGQNPGWLHNIELESSYEFNDRNLLTASFGGYSYRVHYQGTGETSLWDGTSPLYSYREIHPEGTHSYFDFNGHIDYQHLTHRKGETLTLSYLLSTTNSRKHQAYQYEELYQMPVDYTAYETRSKGSFAEHTFQLDWERPLAEHHSLSTGVKYIYRDNNSRSHYDYDNGHSTFSDFVHRTHIGAVYSEYRFKAGAWSARAGLRYEYSYLDADFKDGSQEGFDKRLSDWIPSAGISYRLSPKQTLKLNYLARINRPGIAYLNPTVNESPTNISTGNPRLKSAHPHLFSLAYMLTLPKLTANLSLQYALNHSGISTDVWVDDDIRYTYYSNNLHQRQWTGRGYLRWTLGPTTTLMLNGSVQHTLLRNRPMELNNRRWSWSYYAQLDQRLPAGIKLSLSSNWQEPSISNLYSYTSPLGFYQLNLTRSFLREDRLTLRLAFYCSSLDFQPYSTRKLHYTQGDYTGFTSMKLHAFNAHLRISYRFGSLKASVKKTHKTIQNEDLIGRK